MKIKKVFKIIAWVFLGIFILAAAFFGIAYYQLFGKFPDDKEKYPNYIGYIDQEKALLNDVHTLCNDGGIYGVHHGFPVKAFTISKKHFRTTILADYKNDNYTDSGYLNFRFLVNCEGKAGWFEVIEMNLDLLETDLNDDMVNQLLKLTSNEKHWSTIDIREESVNYYMYISYRIENGEIVEILP